MLWNICFFTAIAVVLVPVAFSIYLLVGKYKRGRKLNVLHVMIAACFVLAVILCIPPNAAIYAGEETVVIKTIVIAFQKAIRVFGADGMYEEVFANIGAAPGGIANAYVTLVLAVQFLAPLLTFSFVLSFFKNVSARIRYAFSYFRDVYIFSELNQKSFILAADILKHHKGAQIVFADVFVKDDEEMSELVQCAREIGAICFKKDIATISFGFHSETSQMYFFAIGDDEMENVNHALKLIGDYNMRKETHLYIFSDGVEGELLLAGKEKGFMKVRRMNEVRSLVSRILYEEGGRIFESAVSMENSEEKQISAVIVGMGSHGTEMLKSLTWYCQMDGYHLKINAFDKEELAEERFTALCPELMSADYNGVSIPGEAEYTITVHAACDVTTQEFAEKIAKIQDATYVFISLGSDEANIQAATNLRMRFERVGAKPVIHAVISSQEAKEALRTVRNSAGQAYNIEFVGDMESAYLEKVVMDSEIEEDAFARHKAYCNGDPDKEEDFWRYEYCYRSSMASAIHSVARKKCHIPGADKKENELTDKEREILESLEHRRWNAYMRSEGYVYSGSPDKSSRNDLAKMHHDLVVYSALDPDEKRKDSRVGSQT